MSSDHGNDVTSNRTSTHYRKSKDNVWCQVCSHCKETKKNHRSIRIPAAPQVQKGMGEGLAKEKEVRKSHRQTQNDRGHKQAHKQVIGSSAMKKRFLHDS